MAYGTVVADVIQNTTGYSLGAGNASLMKNRLINGNMIIAQRGTSGTAGTSVPTTAPVYPCVDRFYVYSTGASVTASQSVVSLGSSVKLLQVAGAASVTAIGVGQRIESNNCYDLAGKAVTISANLSNSLLTTVTWTAYQPTATDNYTSKTQIATGTFTVSSTDTNYQANFTMPSGTMYGLEIIFTVGAQTSGNFYLYNVQLEVGSIATSYEYRQYQQELALCQRYYQRWNYTTNGDHLGNGQASGGNSTRRVNWATSTILRANPSLNYSGTITAYTSSNTGTNLASLGYAGGSTPYRISVDMNTAGSCGTAGDYIFVLFGSGAWFEASSEL